MKKILFTLLTALLLLPVAAYFFVQLPAVQTFLVRQVTDVLSEKVYPASVSVGAVYYSFFTKLIIDDVYVSDAKGDTLLYVNELSASFGAFSYSKKKLEIRSLRLNKGVLNLYTYALDEEKKTTNLVNILSKFKNTPPTGTADTLPAPRWDIKLNNVALSDFHVTFRNLTNPTPAPNPRVIDFKDLDIRNVYVDARRLQMRGDTLFFELNDVRCLEKSGYRLQHLGAKRGYVCSTQTMLEDLEVVDDYSHLVMRYYKMDYADGKSFNDYETDVRMEADFDHALFSFRSIGHMAKNFRMQPDLYLSGVVSGTVSALRSDFVQINTVSSKTQLLAKFRINGLPAIKETMIDINVIRLTTEANDLTGLLQGIVYPDTLNLQVVQPLAAISMIGSFTGLYNDFVTRGVLVTGIGNANVDLSFNFGEKGQAVLIKGDAQAHKLNIGRLLNVAPVLGEVTGAFIADGKILSGKSGGLQIKAVGHLSQCGLLNYNYKNITLNGVVENTGFDGKVTVKDPNLDLYFDGSVRQTAATDSANVLKFDFDADVHHADLAALHLNTRDSVSVVKAAVKAGYEMKNAFEGMGEVAISGIEYTGYKGKQTIGDIHIQSDYHGKNHHIALRSGFLELDYTAQRTMSVFFEKVVQALAKRHVPVVYADSLPDAAVDDGQYILKATLKNAAAVADILLPGLYITPDTQLSVTLSEHDSLNVLLTGEGAAWKDYQLKKISLQAAGNATQSSAELKVGDATILGFTMRNLSSFATLAGNKLNLKIGYDNQTKLENSGNLSATLDFLKDRKDGLLANLQLDKSEVVINDSTWNIAPATIWLNKKIHIDNFHVYNHRQDISVGGALSNDPEDTLTVVVKDFDMSNMNYVTDKEGYRFAGWLSGEAKIVDVYNSLHFSAGLTAQQLLINNNPFGDTDVRGWWRNQDKQFQLYAAVQMDTLRTLEMEGTYSPQKKYLDLTGVFNRFQIVHITPLLEGVLSNMEGALSGNVRLYGPLQNLVTEGTQLYVADAAATVDYLKTRYSFSAPVFLDANSFGFKNAEVKDGMDGTATFSLTASHTNFKDWRYDVAAYPRNLCVMNTTERDNDAFYGRAYATGAALITGHAGAVLFDINLKTEKNSVLHIPASSSMQAKNVGLLSFVQPQDAIPDALKKPVEKSRPTTDMNISLNLSVTPETEVLLELDKKSEDVIRGFGTGDIKMEINPAANKFNMYGDYRLSKGDYLFTVQNFNLITKRFDFVDGGRITFNGDLQRMNLDLSAIYKTTASLSALLADSSAMAARRQVNCRITITGNLFNPVITLGVDIENLDAETRARVQSALNTEEKRTRQFLALLALGGFLSDDQSELSANLLMNSATGLVTSQINNLFSRFNVPLGFGFSYMPSQRGRDDMIEFSFSTQMLNDRIALNGNVGSGRESQSFFNDFDLGIRLDSKNKLHFRAFTRSVDRYTDHVDNSQRYGLGVMYQEEFNNFSELFDRFFGKKKTTNVLPEKEPVIRPDEDDGAENPEQTVTVL